MISRISERALHPFSDRLIAPFSNAEKPNELDGLIGIELAQNYQAVKF